MNLKTWMSVGLVLGMPLLLAAAAAPSADQRLRDSERRQQTIRTRTQRLAEELSAVIDEFESNAMGAGQDVQVLRGVHAVLGKLSDQDMARVVELLAAARDQDSGLRRDKMVEALGGQKTIVVQLRQLLLEYERQQQLYEVSVRFAQLAQRQNLNLKEAKRLVRQAQGRPLDRLDENQKISLSVQKDEQTAIRDEALGVLKKLSTLTGTQDSAAAARVEQGLQLAGREKLEDSLKSAVEELKSANLYRAAASQKHSRDQMRELSRLVAPPKEREEILRLAAAELERVIAQQKQVVSMTQAIAGDDKTLMERAYEAEDQQGDVVDRSDMVQRDIQHIAPIASDHLKKGIDRMQEARMQVLERRRNEATKNQLEAVARLEDARRIILEELSKQAKPEENKDKLALAKELKEKVGQLKAEQEQLKKQTEATREDKKQRDKLAELAPPQTKLQEKTRDLQPAAVQQSVPVADAIAEASREMAKASSALEKKDKMEQATTPQQAAADNLARAERMLDQEIAQLEQAQSDLDALAAAREKVQQLIKHEAKIEVATAKAQAMQEANAADKTSSKAADPAKTSADAKEETADQAHQNKAEKGQAAHPADQHKSQEQPAANASQQKPEDKSAAEATKNSDSAAADKQDAAQPMKPDSKVLAGEQAKNAEETGKAAMSLPRAARDAMLPLQGAKSDMASAQQNLEKGEPSKARPDEKNAIANLERAKDTIDRKIAALQEQLGKPDEAMNSANADLAQAIAKAQEDIKQALREGDTVKPPEKSQAAASQEQMNKPAGEQPKVAGKGEPDGEHRKTKPDQAAKPADAKMARQFQKTAQELNEAAAMASAPPAVDMAIAEATDSLGQASGAAESGNKPAAQDNAGTAQQALARAAAALALAQQGMTNQMQPAPGQQGQQGQQPGNQQANAQGQNKTPGEGKEQGEGQGEGQGKGQGQQGQQGQGTSKSTTEGQGKGSGDRMSGRAAAADKGERANVNEQGQFIRLPARDRTAIMQSRKEGAPSEYAPAIEQYLRNLSDSDEK